MQLAMPVAVITELMTFLRHAPDELRPAFRMAAEDEEGGAHPFVPQDVEDGWRRVRVRTVVEGDADGIAARRKPVQHRSEHPRVPVPGAVRREPRRGDAGRRERDHTATATRPITA